MNEETNNEFKKNLEKFKKMAKRGKETKMDKKPQIIVVGRSNVGNLR